MKYLVAAPVLLIILAMLLGIRPINTPTVENCYEVTGIVEKIYSACDGCHDISFKLEGTSHSFYINRGEESGLDIASLSNNLVGNEIKLMVVKHWTILDPKNKGRHIASLTHQDQIIYSEIKD